MQAVSCLAPALAPLAVKLIDKFLFDDRPVAQVPQIIQIPAPPICGCRCGQFMDEYGSTGQTCSTCTVRSPPSHRSSKHHLSAGSSKRSSSTSDAYEREKSKSTRRGRVSSASDMRTEKKSDKHRTANNNTLAILAGNVKKEISRQSKGKISPRDWASMGSENSSYRFKEEKHGCTSSSGSRKICKNSNESNRRSSGTKF